VARNAAAKLVRDRSLAMRLSKWSYYADFALYPVWIAALATRALWHASLAAAGLALGVFALGLVAWSGLEYALHRWVLHRIEPFRRLHEQHHAHPADFIGTPVWFSAALFLIAWQALARWEPGFLAAGLAAGLMTGYLAYSSVHAAVHHRRVRSGSWLHRAKLRHARHHQAESRCNYAVSCSFWDRVFGTERVGRAPIR
jgi:sterol desaturase/sphingolipid hydroxylase (fatty acid hydroxylase superfamily)